MIERDDVEIATKDGTLTAFYAYPDGAGPFPAVILYMDAPGIREELRDFARRIAGEGYFCLLPDLYYRWGRIRLQGKRDPASVAEYRAARVQLNNAMVADDTEAMLAFIDGQDSVDSGGRACLGFCQSGRFITTVAGRFPDQFAACAAAYGTDIVTDQPDSPHQLVKNIEAEMYYGFAEHDDLVPPKVIETLEAELAEHKVASEVEVYPGVHHGFCFPLRDIYDKASAERYWGKLFALYERRLG
jgi:carboxymethylenebutenolidase